MMYAQYLRIESRAGGCTASPRALIREAHRLLTPHGRSRAQREVRHEWLRAMLDLHTDARIVYRSLS